MTEVASTSPRRTAAGCRARLPLVRDASAGRAELQQRDSADGQHDRHDHATGQVFAQQQPRQQRNHGRQSGQDHAGSGGSRIEMPYNMQSENRKLPKNDITKNSRCSVAVSFARRGAVCSMEALRPLRSRSERRRAERRERRRQRLRQCHVGADEGDCSGQQQVSSGGDGADMRRDDTRAGCRHCSAAPRGPGRAATGTTAEYSYKRAAMLSRRLALSSPAWPAASRGAKDLPGGST